jgi:hypothetical protein
LVCPAIVEIIPTTSPILATAPLSVCISSPATEVKELASQTAKATEEISVQIAGIQDSTRDAVVPRDRRDHPHDITNFGDGTAECLY